MTRNRTALAFAALLLAAAAPAWAQNGLIVEHYNSNNLTGTIVDTRTNQGPIDFDFNGGVDGPGVPVNDDNFSSRYRGLVAGPVNGQVVFQIEADETGRLYIDGVLRATATNGATANFTMTMALGQKHHIMIEHLETADDGAELRLRWSLDGGTTFVVVPLSALSSPAAAPATPTVTPDGGQTPSTVTLSTATVGAEIWYTLDGSDPGLSGPTGNPAARLYTQPFPLDVYAQVRARAYDTGMASDLRVSAQFSPMFQALAVAPTTQAGFYRRMYFHGGGLGNAMPNWEAQIPEQRRLETAQLTGTTAIGSRDGRYDNFAMQFNGYIDIPADGMWQFRTVSDDDSQVLIDGVLVLHNFGGTTDGFIALKAGLHPITVNFYDNTGGESLSLSWMSPPTVGTLTLVPAAAFFTDLIAPTPTSSFNALTNTVQIDVSDGATIYYTTDGSPPDPRNATGTGASGLTFPITATTRVRALAVLPGRHPSPIHDATHARTDLAGPGVVSVVTPGVDNRIEVNFAQTAVNPSASTAGNYSLAGGVTVTGAALQPRNADLRGWWKLDETVTGSTVADSSTFGNDGTPSPGPSPDVPAPDTGVVAPVQPSNAASLNFDGTNDHVNIPHASSLDFGTGSFTVATWIRPFDTTNRRLISKWDGPNDKGWIIDLHNTATGSLRFRVDDGPNGTDLIHPAGIVAGEWQHIAARFDRRSNRISIFRNGTLINSANTSTAFGNCDTTRPILLGRLENPNGSASGSHYRGHMDDVRLYSVALSDAEIAGLAAGAEDPSTRVVLTTSGALQLHPTTYTLTVSNVLNPHGAPQSGSATFSYRTGSVTNEQYLGITGTAVFDLTRNVAFPNNPSTTSLLTIAETNVAADNYGRRLRGYFIPPTTGNWIFSIASDDNSALWLSTDDDPARIRLISRVTSWANFRDHADPDVIQSAPIALIANTRYYFEAIMKEGTGGDNIAVAAKLDDTTPIAADAPSIPASQLAPYVVQPFTLTPEQNRVVMAGQTVTLSVDAVGAVQWMKGATALGTGSRLTLTNVDATTAGTYSVQLTGLDGTISADVVNLTVVTPPAPTISAVTPDFGPAYGRQPIVVTGTNLMWGMSTVSLGGSGAANYMYSVDGTTLYAQTTAHAPGTVDAVVTTYNAAATATLSNGYTYYDTPTIAAVTPAGGDTDGTSVITITGTNFVPGLTEVTFGAVGPVAATVVDGTTLTVTAPAQAAGTVDVVVTTPFGFATVANGFTYYDDPTIGTITPPNGPDQGGAAPGFTTVTIEGANFAPNLTTVTFGAAAPVAANVTSPTTLEVTPPAGTGAVDVTITTPGGSVTATGGYTYYPDPEIGTLTPPNGPDQGGNTITISGTDFVTGFTTVTFGVAAPVAATVTSGTSLDVVVPAGTAGQTVAVTITTPGGTATALAAYTYYADPTATSISPDAHGPTAGGDVITITGTNFVSGFTSVTIGGTGVAVTFNSTTSLTVTTPVGAAADMVAVEVTTPGGMATVPGGYTYHDPPTITSVVANTGTTQGGNNVTVSGTNLPNGLTTITFGGVAGTNVNAAGTTATVDVPANPPGAVDVVVSTPGGTDTLSLGYTDSGPFITPISPNVGPVAGGQTVTITGAGFVDGQTTVQFDAVVIVPTSVTANSITFTTPAAPGLTPDVVDVTVVVASPAGTFTTTDGYEYIGPPTISNLSIDQGPTGGGQTVVINGTNFAGALSVVTFGGTPATITGSVGSTQLTVTTPAHAAGAVDVIVTCFGVASGPSSYTFVLPPTITTILPNRGSTAGGQSVTITGTNFVTGHTEIIIGGATAAPDTLTATSLTFTTPAHAAGQVDVIVRTFQATNSQFTAAGGYSYVDPATSVDLSLTKIVDVPEAVVGQDVTFTIQVVNNGGVDATGVQVSDVLPPGLTFVSANATAGTYSAGTGLWTGFTVPVGVTRTLTIVATVASGATLTNIAEVWACNEEDIDSTPGNSLDGEDDQAEATVDSGLRILTGATLPSGTAGAYYQTTLSAAGGTPPYTWSYVSSVPASFPFNLSASGVISGFAPNVVQTYDVTLRVTDSGATPSTAQRTFTISIGAAGGTPVISGPAPDGMVGVAYDFTYTATGGFPPYTWTVTAGSLPAGLFLNPFTGRLAGTPTTAATSGFTVSATGTDAVAGTLVESVTVAGNPVVFLNATALPSAVTAQFYQVHLEVGGGVGPGFTWSVFSGSAGGLTLSGSGRRATLSGTAPAAGTLNFTLRVTDAGQGNLTTDKAFTIDVLAVGSLFEIGTDTLPTGTLGRPYSARLFSRTAGQPITYTAVSGLPDGLILATNGTLSGTPTRDGTFNTVFQIQGGGLTATKGVSITIASTPRLTSPLTLPAGATDLAYFTQLTATGGAPPLRWTATGVPAGLTLDPTSGAIAGIPTTAATTSINVTVTDANGATHTLSFSLTIADGTVLQIVNTLPGGTVGLPYSATLFAVNVTAPLTGWTVTGGSLPAGLSLDPATGTVSGTPTTAATTSVTIQVQDSAGTDTITFNVVILGTLSITTTALGPGAQTEYYGVTFGAAGGSGTLTWSLASGSLPDGLVLYSDGWMLGTLGPDAATSSFQVRVTDANGQSAVKSFTITVGPAGSVPPPDDSSSGGGGCGGSIGLGAAGGPAALAALALLLALRRRKVLSN